jgi:copper transport protein
MERRPVQARRSIRITMRSLLVALALAFCLVAIASPAEAHATLVESVPADGAVVPAPPDAVTLRFSEPVSPIAVSLLDGEGRSLVSAQDVANEGATLRLALPAKLPAGTYLVSYRVISVDSHPVGGSITFSIGVRSAAPPAPVDMAAGDVGWRTAAAIDRVLFYAGMIVAAGGVLFHRMVAGDLGRLAPAASRRLTVAASMAIAAALLATGLEGGQMTDGSWLALLEPATWRLGLATELGLSLIVSVAGLAALIAGLRVAAPLALAGAVVAIGALALSGHAATADPVWLTAPMLALHLLMVSFWLGSFWPLWSLLRHQPTTVALAALRRFSNLAVGAVMLLAAAGLGLAIIQLGSFHALTDTTYGSRLTFKLVLVLVLVLLALVNRYGLMPALGARQAEARHGLLASILAEAGLALAILATTALLCQAVPPRALAMAGHEHHHDAADGFAALAYRDGNGALVELVPARRGRNDLTLRLFDPDGRPLTPQEVTIELENRPAGIEPVSGRVTMVGPGLYRVDGAGLPVAGRWTIRVGALVSDFVRLGFTVTIPVP